MAIAQLHAELGVVDRVEGNFAVVEVVRDGRAVALVRPAVRGLREGDHVVLWRVVEP